MQAAEGRALRRAVMFSRPTFSRRSAGRRLEVKQHRVHGMIGCEGLDRLVDAGQDDGKLIVEVNVPAGPKIASTGATYQGRPFSKPFDTAASRTGTGTVRALIRAAGMTVDQFVRLL
jgi:hypothetical protein